MKENIFQFKFWKLWAIIVLFYLILSFLLNTYILTESFYYNSLYGQLDSQRIVQVTSFQKKIERIGYLFIPLTLLIKVSSIAGIIFTGTILINQNISFKNCLKITLLAELVTVMAMLVRTGWLIIATPENTEALQYFSPLSITQLINLENVPKFLFYPLQMINVFEIAYWLLLAYGIMVFTNSKFERSLKIVASSYGIALLVWVVFVVFLQVQFT